MSFLAPFFLLGALAVGLPVVFHLIRRTTRERTPFSSLMFLSPSPPRLTRRSRLEHLLLLALRCLVLCLLALGFARPFIKKAMPSTEPAVGSRKQVILVDDSASMRRADLWSAACSKADSLLRSAGPSDQVALYTFDRQLTPVLTFEQWNSTPVNDRPARGSSQLAALNPGWSSTRLADALTAAAELLADAANAASGPRQIVLISDLQEGGRPEQLQGYEWPKGIEVQIESVKPRQSGNASLHLVTETDLAETKSAGNVRLRVSNSADSKREQFKVGWAQKDGRGFAATPLEVYVPPGQSRIVSLVANDRGANRIILQGDEDDFDNTVFLASPERAQLRVVYIGRDTGTNSREPLYFVQRAFQETRREAIEVVLAPPGQPLPAKESTSLLIALGDIPQTTALAIRDLVSSGKTLLFALRNETDGTALGSILGRPDLNVTEGRVASYAMLSDIDFRDPLFSQFSDPRFSDFTKIHFWKYRRVIPSEITGARVLAKFDNGDPAVLEVSLGKGRVVVLTSTWAPEDSQLALSTKFVPLLYTLLEQSSGSAPRAAQYYVGDSIPVGTVLGEAAAEFIISAPDGSQLKLGPSDTNFSQTMTPGLYTVNSPNMRQGAVFAVNLDPAESRTAPVSLDEFERLGVPLTHQARAVSTETARKTRFQNTELEKRQKLWRWVLLGTLAVLLGETWLAGRTARQVAVQGGTT